MYTLPLVLCYTEVTALSETFLPRFKTDTLHPISFSYLQAMQRKYWENDSLKKAP